MQLAGIPIRDEDVLRLAGLLPTGGFDDAADKVTQSLIIETKVLALTITDRESMLWALDDPPTDGLAELRGVLLAERCQVVRGRDQRPEAEARRQPRVPLRRRAHELQHGRTTSPGEQTASAPDDVWPSDL